MLFISLNKIKKYILIVKMSLTRQDTFSCIELSPTAATNYEKVVVK